MPFSFPKAAATTLRRLARRTDGAIAVEFAFVAPMLILLTVGAIDGGRMLLAMNTLEKLANEGARFASVRGSEYSSPVTEADVETYLDAKATGLDASKLAVVVTWPDALPTFNAPGNRVTVAVTYPLDPLFLKFQTFTFTRTTTLNIMR